MKSLGFRKGMIYDGYRLFDTLTQHCCQLCGYKNKLWIYENKSDVSQVDRVVIYTCKLCNGLHDAYRQEPIKVRSIEELE